MSSSKSALHVKSQWALQPLTPPRPSHTAYASHVDMTPLRVGAWDAKLFRCFDSGVNCCLGWCLPCISLAQISHRIGWAKYWTVLLALIGLCILETLVESLLSGTVTSAPVLANRNYLKDSDAVSRVFLTVIVLFTQWGSLTGLVIIGVSWVLRSKIRKLFDIPGNELEDAVASACCTCCSIAQMATHVKSYTPGHLNLGPVDTIPAYLPQ